MKVLVSAASRHGATKEVGAAIAEAIRAMGHEAEVRDPAEVVTIDEYAAVVLGSGVYAGRWLEPARRFAERHMSALQERPVWLFSSGPIGDPLAPTEEASDGLRLVVELRAREHRTFPGRVNTSDLGWVERTIVRMVKAPDGDFRNFEEIRAWGTGIAAALAEETVPA